MQDLSMLSKQALFLLLYDCSLFAQIFLLLTHFLEFELSLGPIYGQFFLPESLDLAFMLLLSHASFLSVHLFKALVVCKLLRQLLFEFVLHSALLCLTLDLKTLLVGLCSKEILLDLFSFLKFLSFSLTSLLLKFLEIELVPEVL